MAVDSLPYFPLAAFNVDRRRPTVAATFFTHRQNFLDSPFFERTLGGALLGASDTEFFACVFVPAMFLIADPRKFLRSISSSMDINRLTHPKDDLCGIQSFYAQSAGPGRYMTTNLTPNASGVNPLAINNQLMYPREGYGLNNSAIDADSLLRNQPQFKSNRCNIRQQARPFLTVPFMAGGRGNPDVESLLMHAEQVRLGKECGTVTENMFEGQFTPMIQMLKDNIQNPKNLIPEVAANGWIRGGIPSREYIRDMNC